MTALLTVLHSAMAIVCLGLAFLFLLIAKDENQKPLRWAFGAISLALLFAAICSIILIIALFGPR